MRSGCRPGFAFSLSSAMLAGGLQLLCAPASAAPAEQLTPTSIPGTFAFVDVPAMFDPLHASDAALAEYGFPPRPDSVRSPNGFRAWLLAAQGVRIPPTLVQTTIFHGPNLPQAAAAAGQSSNWSGYVSPGPALAYGNQSLIGIFGDWAVPTAELAINACSASEDGPAVNSSTFIGLDGNGSGDVLQAGTESDATCSAGVVGAFQDAWYEWYPYDEVRVSNMAILPSSVMYVHVWATSATEGHVYFSNETANISTSIKFSAPPGYSLIGNSAEWIVERPSVDGELSSLTNYVQEFITAAQAVDAQGNDYFPGNGQPAGVPPAEAIDMLDINNKVISVPVLMGHNGIWFNDSGSAWKVPKS
jgi:hypothetical protein